MTATLIDTSVVLDVVEKEPDWWQWSLRQLERTARQGEILINPIIYAEMSIGYQSLEELEATLSAFGFLVREIPRPALFLAGKAFLNYRRRGGARRSPLPDFFIGAHAAVERFPLLTRDVSRIREYFPTVRLIVPGDH
jgi:hypothetical protein